jgi:hypothetical protein
MTGRNFFARAETTLIKTVARLILFEQTRMPAGGVY